MTNQEEIAHLWGLALTKKQGWQYKDFPVVQDSTASLERAWPKAKKKKRLTNGDLVTVTMLELQWQAEARARQQDRQKGVFVPQPVGISAYLNQERWNNEIIISEKKVIEGNKCFCGQDDMGTGFCCYHTNIDENGKFRRNRIGTTQQGAPTYRRLYLEERIEFYKSHPHLKGEAARKYVLNYLNIIRTNNP